MKIRKVNSFQETIGLTQPFSISCDTNNETTLHFLEIETVNGLTGLGSASPGERVTGETNKACAAALKSMQELAGEDIRHLAGLLRNLFAQHPDTPAARAAADMALHDLHAKLLGIPLADMLGRSHQALPTSNTLGIRDLKETLEEAKEKRKKGFSVLKVKIGKNLYEDLERLRRLREVLPQDTTLRVDPNQGYQFLELQELLEQRESLRLEFIEQPLQVSKTEDLLKLSLEQRKRIALDESLKSETDALRYGFPEPYCGIYNIKIMKSGGLGAAQRIALLAELGNLELMWGCNDESCISLSAALHQALACPNTRYLDLDGNLDLEYDPAEGGYYISDGLMYLNDAPGLGVILN